MFILDKVRHGKSSPKNVREFQKFKLADLGLVWATRSLVNKVLRTEEEELTLQNSGVSGEAVFSPGFFETELPLNDAPRVPARWSCDQRHLLPGQRELTPASYSLTSTCRYCGIHTHMQSDRWVGGWVDGQVNG